MEPSDDIIEKIATYYHDDSQKNNNSNNCLVCGKNVTSSTQSRSTNQPYVTRQDLQNYIYQSSNRKCLS